MAGETGNGQGTAKEETDGDEEANGGGKRKGNRWWGELKSTGGSTKEELLIRFGTYNIRNRRNGGLESALRGMSQANMDLVIFQDTKCTDGIYTRELARYRVVATDAPSRHNGGVALLYIPSPFFVVEAVQEYGPNVMSFKVAAGARRWYIIGCYLAPDDTETIERVVTALGDRPKGTALVVAGDLNTDLEDLESNRRGTDIVAVMTAEGVEDMTANFLPRKRRWGRERRTWSTVQEGKAIRSQTDYLLGTDRSLFRNVSVRYPQHNTDHFMMVGCLRSAPEREHT